MGSAGRMQVGIEIISLVAIAVLITYNFSTGSTKGDKMMGSAGRREIGIVIKGKDYTIRELDLDGYGMLENFITTKHVRLYRESAIGVDPEKVEEAVMKIITKTFTAEELGAQTATSDCAKFVAFLCLRHNPGVTRENVGEIVTMDNIKEITTAIDAMGDDDEANPPEKEQESP
jgi:hypothetical protein